MFGFNRNRGIFNIYNNSMKEESFIRKYMIFKIKGRIFGAIFLILTLFTVFTMRDSYINNNATKNNNSYINNSAYKDNASTNNNHNTQ